jgi:hypothetical protein
MAAKTLASLALATALLAVSACAVTSHVMEAENGTYLIAGYAAPARGGAAGATDVAYTDAQKFCVGKGQRAIVLTAQDRDVYQGAAGGSWNQYGGGVFSGVAAAGHADLHFKCV